MKGKISIICVCLLLLCSLLGSCAEKKECYPCRGTGVCHACDGTGVGGKLSCNSCHSLAFLIPYCTNCEDGYVGTVECYECEESGNGVCYFCGGTGYEPKK